MRRSSRPNRPTRDPFIKLIVGAALLLMLAIALIVLLPGRTGGPTFSGVNTLGPNTPGPSPTVELPVIQYRPSAAGWIAYVKDSDIWLVHPDGSSPKQVTRDTAGKGPIKMEWSTDGTLLAFSQGGTISVLDVAGLGTRVLAEKTGGNFGWSATARQLVYDTAATSDDANDGLWVVSADDGKTLQVAKSTPDHPLMTAPQWSFDSNSVIFTEPAGPRLLTLSTGVVSPLVPGSGKGAACSWSPVELVIACVDGDPPEGKPASVYLLNENGIEKQHFSVPAGHLHARLGPWSADGGSIAIIYSTGADATDLKTDLFSLDTGEFKPAGEGAATSWSPDGRWVVMDGGAAQPITVVNTTSALSSTLGDGLSPQWQPSASEAVTLATAAPVGQSFCMDTSVGFVHKKPLGHYLIFCIGSQKYNYGALAAGVYLVGPATRYFIYVSNSGYVFAARMGAPALTRLGNVRWMKVISYYEDVMDPNFQIRPIPGYPYQFKLYENTFDQKADFTLPRWIVNP